MSPDRTSTLLQPMMIFSSLSRSPVATKQTSTAPNGNGTHNLEANTRQDERPHLGHGTKKQTELDALYNKVQSNMDLQQISLNKLAARENHKKGLGSGSTGLSYEVDFKELLRNTEEFLRLLYAQRMSGFESSSSN